MADVPLNALWSSTVADGRFERRPANLVEVLVAATDAWADREFLVQGRVRLRFREVAAATARVAARLAERGLTPGARAAVFAANGPAWVVAAFGILRAGGVAVLANRWWGPADLERALEDSGATVLVADARGKAAAGGVDVFDLDALVGGEGEPAWEDLVLDEADPAYVVFTSGTTGRPKPALVSHRSAVANTQGVLVRARQVPPFVEDRPQMVSLCALPLFHLSGVQTLLQNLVAGGRLVFLDGRFSPAAALDAIERERVTTWAAVPTMLAMVLDDESLPGRDLTSVRALAVGGAPVPPALLARAYEAFPEARRRTAHSYGSTEAGGTVATGVARPDGTALVEPLPTVEVRIAAPDAEGNGEILVRSPALMDRYLGVPDDEQPIDGDGWLHTGDVGRFVEGGLLEITGRSKDVIIRGGENVAARHVEDVLGGHPDVGQAVVVGVPDPKWGEEVAAVVRPRPRRAPAASELAAFAAAHLPRFAVPTRWLVREEPFPMTASGKVRKDVVREWFS